MMRAKMTVNSVERSVGGERVKLGCVYSNTPEDNSFSKATPSGDASLFISNPDLIGKLNPGDQFYVDFTLIEVPKAA